MGLRKYDKLNIEDFGTHLLESNDLDPVYVALVGSNLDPEQMRRWLLAYWCFYDAGVSSWLSEHKGKDFFAHMRVAAYNIVPPPIGGRWRRAKERRHFRGADSVKAVDKLESRYRIDPENMVNYCAEGGPTSCQEVMKRAKEHHLFGDWIAFKVADMIDRCLKIKVDFDEASAFMFKDPTQSALMLWRMKLGLSPDAIPRDEPKAINEVVSHLTNHFKEWPAPPFGDRPVGLQEVETILCKWKSHMNGHYPLFNDQDEINEGIKPWIEFSQTAERFYASMPKRTHAAT